MRTKLESIRQRPNLGRPANLKIWYGGFFVETKRGKKLIYDGDGVSIYIKEREDNICYRTISHIIRNDLGFPNVGVIWYRRKGLSLEKGLKQYKNDACLAELLETRDQNNMVTIWVEHWPDDDDSSGDEDQGNGDDEYHGSDENEDSGNNADGGDGGEGDESDDDDSADDPSFVVDRRDMDMDVADTLGHQEGYSLDMDFGWDENDILVGVNGPIAEPSHKAQKKPRRPKLQYRRYIAGGGASKSSKSKDNTEDDVLYTEEVDEDRPSPDLFSENVSQRINTENIRHDDGVIGEASEQQRATTEQPSQLGRPEPEGEEQNYGHNKKKCTNDPAPPPPPKKTGRPAKTGSFRMKKKQPKRGAQVAEDQESQQVPETEGPPLSQP
ncbi:hypothetical protein BVRB_4g092390 [Beta vulgaris subsp. vulgaris]|nr:hypothetical protein BVRB_4g092390 [Beta vulgaris subsp. vulgaris]